MGTRRTKWKIGVVAALLILGFAGYFAAVGVYYDSVAPKGLRIGQLAERLKISSVKKCERNGLVYYLVVGASPPGYVLASGPPVYVFDKSGTLVEWIEDSGDQPTDMAKWDLSSSPDIPLEQALREIEDKGSG